jgi:hypothetical protein
MRKINIISNGICYGPAPEPNDEVEQSLTIAENGRVWFTGYNFGDEFGEYRIGRRIYSKIEPKLATEILDVVDEYNHSDHIFMFATDIGSWEMIVTDGESKEEKYSGSLCGGVIHNGININELITNSITIEDLWVFGQGFEDDEE